MADFSFMPKTLNSLVRRDEHMKLSLKLSTLVEELWGSGPNRLNGVDINLLTTCYLKDGGETTDNLAVLVYTSKDNSRYPDLEKAVSPYQVIYRKGECKQL